MAFLKKKYIIGVRLEEKSHESRVPLIPYDINDLVNHEYPKEIEVLIEKSRTETLLINNKYLKPRCFTDKEFKDAGAIVSDNLDKSQVILGIKEIPITNFEENKTYVFFSHTYKGQDYNRDMFLKMMEKKCTLIDYELIVENETEYKFDIARTELDKQLAPASKFTRTVYFGKHAGIVGAINTLWVLGLKQKHEGIASPFTSLKQTIKYKAINNISNINNSHKEGIHDYKLALQTLKEINHEIQSAKKKYRPIIIGITGKSTNPHKKLGNTAKGAKEVIDILNPIEILPHELLSLEFNINCVYVVYFDKTHTQEIQFKKYLEKLTIVLNCMKWEKENERPMSVKNIKNIFINNPKKTLIIGDITCDPGGSVEPCQDVYSDKPFYIYEPIKDNSLLNDWIDSNKRKELFKTTCTSNSLEGIGPIIMSITNLPCELPKEASRKFSFMLREYIMDIAKVDGNAESLDKLNIRRPVKRAIIIYKGELTPDYKYLKEKYAI